MRTKREIKKWLENQEQLSMLDKFQMSQVVDDVHAALKHNPKRKKFEFNIGYLQIPHYAGLNPE